MTVVRSDETNDSLQLLLALAEKFSRPGFERKRAEKGEILYREGENPKGLYIVENGLACLISSSPSGAEVLFRVFGNGDVFGHRSLVLNSPYHANLNILEDCRYYFFPVHKAQYLIKNSSEFLFQLARIMARELGDAERKFLDLADKNVKIRIIESLLFLKSKYPEHLWTRKEIGEFCGAQQETVTRLLKTLEAEKLIEKKGREIVIPDPAKVLAKARSLYSIQTDHGHT